ncbi:AIR synthase-related protein, partial [Klebsiella pneumoniae]|uniref:AIR synthase-related protein n=1 Tax=Klebsiella pneumoniae TaxID=573 RepID=UPI003854E1CA
LQSAHDISEGGLVITLLESAFAGNKGFLVNAAYSIRNDAFWFGEAQGRVVVSVNEGKQDLFVKVCETMDIPYLHLGIVTDSKLTI